MLSGKSGVLCVLLLIATAGCIHVGTDEAVFEDNFNNSELPDWDVRTYGNGEGEVGVRDEGLFLRVNGCQNAEARTGLGEQDGNLTVEFDWRSTAEQWYENPGWRVWSGGENASYTVVEGADISNPGRANTSEGYVRANVSVSGNTTLVYEITPSQYCSNLDHANTTLTVDNITVER